MKTIERVFQAVIFEVSTLAIVVPTTVLVAGFETEKMAIVSISLSLFALLWNYIYNIAFDKVAGHNRIERGVVVRVSHAVIFELGMIVLTLPMMAWYLDITWIAAAALEAGFLVFILIYTFIFNWLYDKYQPYKNWVSKAQFT
jgi:uncharacterized membrane protein